MTEFFSDLVRVYREKIAPWPIRLPHGITIATRTEKKGRT